jgi:hypothetical protein
MSFIVSVVMDINWVLVWISIIVLGFLYALYGLLKATIERYERMKHERHESLIGSLKKVNDKLYSINCNLNSVETGLGLEDSFTGISGMQRPPYAILRAC